MKLSRYMHSLANRLTIYALVIIVLVFGYLIYRDAYNDVARILGLIFLLVLFLFTLYLFLILFRIYDKLEFYEDKIVRVSVFKKEEFKYEDFIGIIGKYTSIIEKKKAIILTPNIYNGAVTIIDTSKFGNVIQVNKMKVLYCLYDDELFNFLDNKL